MPSRPDQASRTTWLILVGVSLCHAINDIMQSLLAALYPLLAQDFALSFSQIGVMTLAFQGTASILQPVVGLITDKRPMPLLLPLGMGATLVGVGLLAYAGDYAGLLAGAILIGIGSAVFHPESSRIARAASGGRFGVAQSLFQLGGNAGSAFGPLMAALIVVPLGRPSVAWFILLALLGMVILQWVAVWYAGVVRRAAAKGPVQFAPTLSRGRIIWAMAILAILTASKNAYTASLGSYYTFFLIDRFGLGIEWAQKMLFLYLAAAAVGVMLGGLIGDRIGPLVVIWVSILGALPLTLALPYLGLYGTAVVSVLIGLIMASAFPAIVVFAQDLLPGRVGLVAGIMFGFAFGMGGIAAAVVGLLADLRGIAWVFQVCAFLPLVGLFTIFLPRQSDRMQTGVA